MGNVGYFTNNTINPTIALIIGIGCLIIEIFIFLWTLYDMIQYYGRNAKDKLELQQQLQNNTEENSDSPSENNSNGTNNGHTVNVNHKESRIVNENQLQPTNLPQLTFKNNNGDSSGDDRSYGRAQSLKRNRSASPNNSGNESSGTHSSGHTVMKPNTPSSIDQAGNGDKEFNETFNALVRHLPKPMSKSNVETAE